MFRQGRQFRIVADEQPGRRTGGHFRHQRHQGAEYQQEDQRMPQQALEFLRITGSVIIADDGRHRDVVPEENGGENVAVIQEDRIGRHPVLAHHPEELEVVADGEDIERDIAHIFGQSVAGGLQEGFPLHLPGDHPQRTAVVAAGKIPQREKAAHAAGEHRRGRRPGEAPMEDDDEQGVEGHVRDRADDGHERPQLRPFRRHVKGLETHLQHEGRKAESTDGTVYHTESYRITFRA